nr:site-specific DNA-methyltransferase [Candidatus Sigynarchaeota archaeon]
MSKEKNKLPARNESAALEWKSKGEATQDVENVTFETVEHHAGKNHPGSPPNRLIHGDNQRAMLELLAKGWEGKIDLIYIDPPFWTGDDYYINGDSWNDGNGSLAYTDRWAGGIDLYLNMIHPRLVLARRLLKDTGSMFVHLDWHVSHYVKVVLDEIFGRTNLRNEIIWYYGGPSPIKSSFPRKHDVIFFYSKSAGCFFQPQYNPIKQYLRDRARKDPDGRLWVDQNVGKITERKFNELAS